MAKKQKKVVAVEMPKRGRGRPRVDDPPKPRQIGRIHDDRWELWQRATSLSEITFTEWASKALDDEAKRVLRKHGII